MALFAYIASLTVAVALIAVGMQAYLSNKTYLFDQKELQLIAERCVADNLDQKTAFANITQELRNRYPGHILPEVEFIFINAGGWMGTFGLLHASLTEYVLIFGTEMNTSGNSGRYWADIWDTMLSGEFRQWKEGTTSSVVYKAGDTIYHAKGEVTGVQWVPGTYMLELGRGAIPSTMVFALADTVFSTTDFVTLAKTFRIYGNAVFRELLQGKI